MDISLHSARQYILYWTYQSLTEKKKKNTGAFLKCILPNLIVLETAFYDISLGQRT